jgi:hypothetical protein
MILIGTWIVVGFFSGWKDNQPPGSLKTTTSPRSSGTTFGTVNLVRSSDIEEMSFDLNLPNGVFDKSQNPTYTTGNPTMTEVALLNNNKETLPLMLELLLDNNF